MADSTTHGFASPLPPRRHDALPPSRFWSIRSEIPRPVDVSLTLSTILIPLTAWFAWTFADGGNLFLPSPAETWEAAVRLWSEKGLLGDIVASSLRVLAAFLLAAAIGIPLGLFAGTFRSMEALILPVTGAIRYMPVAAFIPLVILWVGIGEGSKVLIIFLGVVFVNVMMIADAVKFVPSDMLNSAYTLGATRAQVVRKVILPAIGPSIVDTLRVNVSGAWNYLVVAELIASSEGLGFRIMRAQRFLQTEDIFVCILIIGLIGIALDMGFKVLSRRLFAWAHNAT